MIDIRDIAPLVLAGGKGIRLRPVVADLPKVVAEINGKPFLTFIFDQLIESGFRDVILCTGYGASHVQSILGTSYQNLTIRYSVEESALGTGGALRNALNFVGKEKNIIMAFNGDSFTRLPLFDFIEWHSRTRAHAAVVLAQVQDISRFGSVELNQQNKILQFVEKNPLNEPGWINAGMYLFEKSSLAELPSGQPCSLENEFLPFLIEKGLFGYKSDADFIDIGTPESFFDAAKFFPSNQTTSRQIDIGNNS